MNVYTDPRLLDVAGAVDALPDLRIDDADFTTITESSLRATGTDDESLVAPTVAPNLVQHCTSESTADILAFESSTVEGAETPEKSNVSRGSEEWAMRGSNPRHPRCKRGALAN